jgi:phosphonate transport system substrate-binding protein
MTGGRPTVLRYAFTSTAEEPEAASHRQELTRRYLERELHMEVQMVLTTAYGAVIEAFRSNKIDAASISPFSYVLATQKVPIEAIVMRGSKSGEPGEYSGVLAVPGNSPIHSVDDLVRHAKELTISFVDPASTSGFLVENAFLQSKGIEPQRDFKRVVFSLSHPASLLTLKAGKVDVAATMQRLVTGYEQTGKLSRGDVRIIWVSPSIPNQPIAVRRDLPQDFKEQIRQAFIDMPKKDPEVWANQSSSALPASSDQVYVAANDAMFDGLREMARGVKNLSLLEH